MVDVNRQHTAPISVQRSRRNHEVVTISSMPAGKLVPLAAIPMFREDDLFGSFSVAVEMMETNELLLNPVKLRVTAYVVPALAFDRFEGSRDQFDRSYMGQPKVAGGAVVPFIETHAMGTHGSKAVYKALGLHANPADLVNTGYLETYNTVWNFRAKNRSRDITARARLDDTLAPAFWHHSRFQHVVPDFDQAVMDGEVALNVVNALLPVKGIGSISPFTANASVAVRESGGGTATYASNRRTSDANFLAVRLKDEGAGALYPDVYAEMAANGITVSLSNLDLARKTQAFAKLRAQYEGIADEYIIDMLMDGLSIPDQALKQPILLADQSVTIRQAKRYATDAANLAESAVSGGGSVNIRLRVPQLTTGGVVMIFAEAVPEQLFERQRDPYFHSQNVDAWPEYLRDYLDPQKVDFVYNAEIDTAHATPLGVFGYAPMNWKWNAFGPRAGGKFYRPTTNTAVDGDRKRFWAVENINPALAADFYLVNGMHNKPFLDEVSDPFEVAVGGNAVIGGNTVFGGVLVEAAGNYDAVMAKAPQGRIDPP